MYRLNATELSVLREVQGGRERLEDIARAIGRSHSTASEAASGLVDKGFLEREKRGMGRRLIFSANPFVSPLRDMLQRRLPLQEWLIDSGLPILSVLSGTGDGLRAADIVLRTGLSPATVRNYLPAAKRRGVVKKTQNGYRLSAGMSVLLDFLDRYAEFVAGRVLRSFSAKAVLRRRAGFEFIFTVPAGEVPKAGFPTGVTAFTRRGVLIRSNLDYYHYTPFRYKEGLEDYILDCAVAEKMSVNNLTYSLIFLKNHRRSVSAERLRAVGRAWGAAELAGDMLRFVDDGASGLPGFPRRDEFEEKYFMYGDR